jgi:hypothetical protein
MKRKNEKEAKTSKRKRIKWNSKTISKETKKNIKVGLSVFQVYTLWSEKKQKNCLIRFASKQNKAKNVYFVSLRSETKKSEAKWSDTKKFLKRNKGKIRCIDFALVGSEKFEAKRSKMKWKQFFFVSRERAKRISFCFVLLRSENIFEAKPAHPYTYHICFSFLNQPYSFNCSRKNHKNARNARNFFRKKELKRSLKGKRGLP